MKILGIIPSRYDSTRFPGKPLADIQGKTMIQRVYEQASKSSSLNKVVVATDNQEIFDHVKGFGGEVIMTSMKHENGTSRCLEAYEEYGKKHDFVINIQGDEPFIQPEQIDLLAKSISAKETQIATLIKKIDDEKELFDPGTVKVVSDTKSNAIYFSRSTIPFLRDSLQSQWLNVHEFYKHIGIYAYKVGILEELNDIKSSKLEKAENLEQLKWIENGFKIKVSETELDSHGVDTPEDLEKINRDLAAKAMN